jgi:hypothetical protein
MPDYRSLEVENRSPRRVPRRPKRSPPPPKTTLAAALMLVGGIVGWNFVLLVLSMAILAPVRGLFGMVVLMLRCVTLWQILLTLGTILRFDNSPKERERGLAMIILGAISKPPPL